MAAYQKELEGQKGAWQDKLVFKINKATSNFSQSWVRALGCYLLLAFLFLAIDAIPFFLDLMPISIGNFASISSILLFGSQLLASIDWFKIFAFLLPLLDPRIVYERYKDGFIGTFYLWSGYKLVSVLIIYQFIMALRNQTRRR